VSPRRYGTVKRSARIETAVGVFAVIGMMLLVVIFFVLLQKEHAFEGRFRLVAVFDNVSGLKPGAAVQLAGIDIGSVESVQFNEENRAEVVLLVRNRFRQRIYKDARASLATMGLLGDKFIVLTSGTPAAGAVEEEAVIATERYMEIGDIMSEVRPALENIQQIVGNVSTFLTSLEAPVNQMEELLTSATEIAEQINVGEGTAGLLIKDPELYSRLVTLIDDSDQTVRELRTVAEDIRVASQELPELSSAARRTLASAEQATSDFSDLVLSGRDIVKNAKAASEDLPGLIKRADHVAANLEEITDNVRIGSDELPDLLATGREGVEKGLEVVEAARKSWLVRGHLHTEIEREPSVRPLRDVDYAQGE
jgi:phospholipid/cholesterol/gamma-HCH transport system substrate-binding protein